MELQSMEWVLRKRPPETYVAEPQVCTVFQPIIDTRTGSPLGWELLSRGLGPEEAPDVLFRCARAEGRLWDLERACRASAARRIAQLPAALRGATFFLNVSPDVLTDPRFRDGFTRTQLARHGLDHRQIVIEITEQGAIGDYERFEQLVRHYAAQGFRIAVDDFGSGHSSLVTLIRSRPDVIKLDREVVRALHERPYQQSLVRSLVSFATSVDTKLVAEGVETWDELETLVRLGVRYVQGFLLARPSPEPCLPSVETAARLRSVMRAEDARLGENDERVTGLAAECPAVERGAMRVEELGHLFRARADLDHVVLVEDGRPAGVVTRQRFQARTGGPFGYQLYCRRPVDALVDSVPLVVDACTGIAALGRLVLERMNADVYDPVVVVNEAGGLVGTVTMRQLLGRVIALELQSAQEANPLTGLPGNRSITRWLRSASDQPRFSVVYADLDRFKEFNDVHGFLAGDELIRLAARVLSRGLPGLSPHARLGHVGGDDFVVVSPDPLPEAGLQAICDDFDREKQALFDPDELYRGSFQAKDRHGETAEVPLVTLSIAAIESEKVGRETHPGRLSQLAGSLKTVAKRRTALERRSAFVFERRHT
jgi:EAL domain-containing protein (putative c-di-GMP-specific phosphodiesterase class I)/GGDEF domain-containing protein